MKKIISMFIYICFAFSMLGVVWLNIESHNHRSARIAKLNEHLLRARKDLERYRAFYDACRPATGDWVKVECGQSVLRCVHIERATGRMNELKPVIVGPAIELCKPTKETP